jgi:hypothetical protein
MEMNIYLEWEDITTNYKYKKNLTNTTNIQKIQKNTIFLLINWETAVLTDCV